MKYKKSKTKYQDMNNLSKFGKQLATSGGILAILILTKLVKNNCEQIVNICENVEFGAVKKCADLVDLKNKRPNDASCDSCLEHNVRQRGKGTQRRRAHGPSRLVAA